MGRGCRQGGLARQHPPPASGLQPLCHLGRDLGVPGPPQWVGPRERIGRPRPPRHSLEAAGGSPSPSRARGRSGEKGGNGGGVREKGGLGAGRGGGTTEGDDAEFSCWETPRVDLGANGGWGGWGSTEVRRDSGRGSRGARGLEEGEVGDGAGRHRSPSALPPRPPIGRGVRGPPVASARLPPPGAPVPTCSALRPEPGSSSGRSERSPAPHHPAAPSPPRAYAAAAPALKRTKRNRKRLRAKKKKEKEKSQEANEEDGGMCAQLAERGSRRGGAGDRARGSRQARAARSRLLLGRPPGARLAARPRPSPGRPSDWRVLPPVRGKARHSPAPARGRGRELLGGSRRRCGEA